MAHQEIESNIVQVTRRPEHEVRVVLPELDARPAVPDPLEGVIPGENRQERYARFHHDVLGKIWPQKNSGEYGDDFWRTSRWNDGDISGYTHFSPLALDPTRLTPAEFDTMVDKLGTPDYVRLRSIPPALIDPETRPIHTGGSCVVETWGMRSMAEINKGVEDGIFDRSTQADVARKIVSFAPTISHISGAMLGGTPTAVHYDETDMWAERLTDWGIPKDEAAQLTDETYRRINAAVTRRARLINPDAVLISVNFDELGLDKAVPKWFDEMEEHRLLPDVPIGYDPNVRVVEVMETYVGPNLREDLKSALYQRIHFDHLDERQIAAATKMMDATHVVRGKQMDHLRWGSMNLPKEVIVGKRPWKDTSSPAISQEDTIFASGEIDRLLQAVHDGDEDEVLDDESQAWLDELRGKDLSKEEPQRASIMTEAEEEQYRNDYAYRMGIEIMRDVYRRNQEGTATAVGAGFADLPAAGLAVQHESRNVGHIFEGAPGSDEFTASLERSLETPARLHTENVEAHLAYLESYTRDISAQRGPLVAEKGQLLTEIRPQQGEISTKEKALRSAIERIPRYEQDIKLHEATHEFTSAIASGRVGEIEFSEAHIDAAKTLKIQKEKAIASVQAKANEGKELTENDRRDLQVLPEVVRHLEEVIGGERNQVFSAQVLQEFGVFAEQAARSRDGMIKQKADKEADVVTLTAEIEDIRTSIAPQTERIQAVETQIRELGNRNVFPLSENPFVHHAMNFLWDPDFPAFLTEAVRIQEGLTLARQALTEEKGPLENLVRVTVDGDAKKARQKAARTRLDEIKREENTIRGQAAEDMRGLTARILPKVETYIKYLYNKADYPTEMRSTRLVA